ncbi:MAG: PIG-L deacetylase family protein [bacterium]
MHDAKSCRFTIPMIAALAGVLFLWMSGILPSSAAAADELRIIVFGAHPDDCEISAGGCAIKWSKQGHKVKFVSTTNGDIGHSVSAGGPLAIRRIQEAQAAAKVLGVETQVLDIHDGELMPTLENRKTVIRLIREWNADIVITNRTNDYHPDHRYTGILVQDAAYMVTVPFICPDVPPLKKNPVFLYCPDDFQKPNPFQADIVVSIDDVIDQKTRALACMVSQFQEYGANGPGDPAKFFQGDEQEQSDFIRKRFGGYHRVWDSWRPILEKYYGAEKAKNIRNVEAYELCEYGRQPSMEEWKVLFPFFSN